MIQSFISPSRASEISVIFGLGVFLCVGVLSADAATLVRKPYLQNVMPNGISVLMKTSDGSDVTVKYGTTLSYGLTANTTTRTATSGAVEEAKITGLSPNTVYYYQIVQGTTALTPAGDTSYFFKTAPPIGSAQPFTFAVAGDIGKNKNVSALDARNPDIYLIPGDVVYNYSTDGSTQDVQHFGNFAEIFKNTPMYPTCGNHDSSACSTLVAEHSLPQGGNAAGVSTFSFDYGNVHFTSINSNSPSGALTWAMNDIKNSTQPWKVVFWHHNGWSAGSHGSNTNILNGPVKMAQDAGADLVFWGHSHVYERWGRQGGPAFFTIGNGGQASGAPACASMTPSCLAHSNGEAGFLLAEVNGDNLTLRYITQSNTNPDTSTYTSGGGGGGGGLDTTAPNVSITAPANGATVSGVATISAVASDNVGVVGVQFTQNGSNLGTEDTSAPYGISWDTTAVANGSYSIASMVRDAAGNTTTSGAITVTVSNGSASAPTLSLSANPTSISLGGSSTLSWNSTNTTSCVASGGWSGAKATSGSQVISSIATTTTYTLACTGAGGVATQSVTVSVVGTPTGGALTFLSVADATLVKGSPSSNFGVSTDLQLDASSGSPTHEALFKFIVTGLNGKTVKSAKLRLYNVNSSITGGSFHRVADNSWAESSVTWSNAPVSDTATLATLGAVTSGTWYEMNVTSLVTGDGTYSILGKTVSSDGADYSSKEADNSPELVVEIADGGSSTTDTTAPSTPAGLTAVAVSSSQINLSWNASTDNVGVTGYTIYRGGAQVATVSGTSFQNTGLSANTTYGYTIAAHDAAGNMSTQSASVSATTQSAPAVPAPTLSLSANPTSISLGGSSTLSWNSTNTTSCVASGGWSGAKATSGSQVISSIATTTTYTLACTGAGGVATQSVTVSVATPEPPPPGGTACHLLRAGSSLAAGFGAPWNVFSSAQELLMKVFCEGGNFTLDIGNGASTQYIYNKGYQHRAGAWQPLTYTCSNLIGNAWCVGNARGAGAIDTTQTVNSTLAYICNLTGSQWKCGCRDNACATSYWNLQQFQPVASIPPTPTPPPSSGSTLTLDYPVSAENFANPERGFMKQVSVWVDRPLDPTAIRSSVSSDSLAWIYFRLDNYRDPRDGKGVTLADYKGKSLESLGSGKGLDTINSTFAEARKKGLKLVIRFIYNWGPSWSADPNQVTPDAPLALALQHINQIQPLLVGNADVIAAMQAGFVGHWGEWHSSKYLHTIESKKAITDALLNALPKERMLQFRYPRYKEILFQGPITASEAFTQTDRSRIGHHNDCFLADGTDSGTYRSESVLPSPRQRSTYCDGKADTAQCWKDFVAEEGRFTPIGGESCQHNPPRTDCATALKELGAMHWSFLNDDFSPEVLNGWKAQGCMDDIQKRLGYRFVLKKATIPETVAPGSSFNFTLEIKNDGFAELYNKHLVYAVLKNASSRTDILLANVDARKWESGGMHTLNATVNIPSTMAPGTYDLALWLPDTAASLRNKPSYAVRFANVGVWEASTGVNIITNRLKVR